jgi:hypothetical protein
MGDGAITHKARTRGCRTRGLSPHLVDFAKGVLIGGIVLMSLWLLLG